MTDPKAFSTMQARCALAGVELHAIRNDAEAWTFIATAGAITREFPALDDVGRWLESLESAAAREGAHA